ncbi:MULTISPECIES: alpha-D-ribose 1-methylphosphonate 5-triphosphate diphosphatase [Rhodomicrobium]|uniref:alpha-D-ribose 1-methylphosphonate 5-triphosphate diphosphatase n=1 Tax=Rhodomicrobium TaxID=1068 RepID=UPI000B4BCDED|nr:MULTISPECIES: alpha-D-ribose 1-methylphosphonate 5-triphosphate diphosphatase [Rhodomicrobium]
MSETILTNARLVLGDRVIHGTLASRGDVITDISETRSQLASAIDCEGDIVIPGLIELHTDNLERHVTPRPATYWPCDAAVLGHDREIAAAGITTVFNALCVGEVHSRTARVKLLNEMSDAVEEQMADGALKADHYFHWRCEISYSGMIDLLEPLMDYKRLRLLSVMDHTPGQRQFTDINRYVEYYQGKFGMTDEELKSFIAQREEDQRNHSARNREAVVRFARDRGLKLASHDDATIPHVEEAARDGMAIAEFPTTVEAATASHRAGLQVLMGAPNIVRGKSHSGNVSARELGQHGVLDILSSDYVPGSLLYGALLLAQTVEGIDLPQAVATVTRNPARAVGLDDRGEIGIGLRADLVRFRETRKAPVIRDVWRGGRKIA